MHVGFGFHEYWVETKFTWRNLTEQEYANRKHGSLVCRVVEEGITQYRTFAGYTVTITHKYVVPDWIRRDFSDAYRNDQPNDYGTIVLEKLVRCQYEKAAEKWAFAWIQQHYYALTY